MSEALTYSSLVQDMKDYAERDDSPFISQIPRLIMLAENRLASEIKGLGSLKVASFTLTASQPVYEKPARWRETKDFSILVGSVRSFLLPRSYEYCRMYASDAASPGVPTHYADYDYEHFYLARTPDDDYTAELMYYERPEPLSLTNETNWTTQYAPQLILYASLLEAQSFLKLPERVAEFQGLYDRAVGAITKENMSRTNDHSVVRNKQ
jgi:hypothetical protein